MGFLIGLLQPIALKLLGVVAIAGAVAAVLLGARQGGKAAARVEGMKMQLKNVGVRNEADRDAALGGDAGKRLRDKWARD